jgi:hypothetical protein
LQKYANAPSRIATHPARSGSTAFPHPGQIADDDAGAAEIGDVEVALAIGEFREWPLDDGSVKPRVPTG